MPQNIFCQSFRVTANKLAGAIKASGMGVEPAKVIHPTLILSLCHYHL
jgi:hypothetical protein